MLNKGKGGFCGVQSSDWRSRYYFYAEGEWAWKKLGKLEEQQPWKPIFRLLRRWVAATETGKLLVEKKAAEGSDLDEMSGCELRLEYRSSWLFRGGMEGLPLDTEHRHYGLEKLAGGMNHGHGPHACTQAPSPKHTPEEGRKSPAPAQAGAPICTYLHSMNTR